MTTIYRRCKTCYYADKLDQEHLWCCWLGKAIKKNRYECEDGYKEKD